VLCPGRPSTLFPGSLTSRLRSPTATKSN
jgi:hypothetical protein